VMLSRSLHAVMPIAVVPAVCIPMVRSPKGIGWDKRVALLRALRPALNQVSCSRSGDGMSLSP
jgi:hypothetical protein